MPRSANSHPRKESALSTWLVLVAMAFTISAHVINLAQGAHFSPARWVLFAMSIGLALWAVAQLVPRRRSD
ncbi:MULTISPECIES: hypothetical protein [unclassified Luteococcus]